MKKHILLALCIGLSAVSASAQHYRGFLDFTTTIPVSNTDGTTFEDASGITIGGTTSHGVQFKNLFIGAGVGAMIIPDTGCFGLPVFVDGRWDFFRGRTVNFFVGCKLGYVINAIEKYGIYLDYGKSYSYYVDNGNVYESHWTSCAGGYGGIYFQPSIGIRFRLNRIMGINFALSYIPLKFNKETDYFSRVSIGVDSWGGTEYEYVDEDWCEYSKFWSHRIALSVGLDF